MLWLRCKLGFHKWEFIDVPRQMTAHLMAAETKARCVNPDCRQHIWRVVNRDYWSRRVW